MSYQVLARKWRPQRFSEVVGQQHVLSALENGLREQRLHHAYLFSGTRGVGKTSIARLFAKGLNCEKGITANPCGECPHCKAIEEGRFIDLIEIDAASRTKVEDTRELLDNVQYKPTVGRFKVYLIDEVHMLSRHSFNALLKTLEEPPEYVKFLLATTDPQKLPITILSRCMQFHLRALEQVQIRTHLEFVLKQEAIPFELPALEKLAKAAQGSVRDALSLTDQAIAISNANITLQVVSEMLGLIDDHHSLELVQALANADGEKMMSVIQAIAEKGSDWQTLLNDIAEILHRIAMIQLLKNHAEQTTHLHLLAQQISPEDVQFFYQLMLTGKQELLITPEPRIGVEMTMLRALAFHPKKIEATLSSSSLLLTQSSSTINPPPTTQDLIKENKVHGGSKDQKESKDQRADKATSNITQLREQLQPTQAVNTAGKTAQETAINAEMSSTTEMPSPAIVAMNARKALQEQRSTLIQSEKKKPIAAEMPNAARPQTGSKNQSDIQTRFVNLATEQSASTAPSSIQNIKTNSDDDYRWTWLNPELEEQNETVKPSDIRQSILQERTPEILAKMIAISCEQDAWCRIVDQLHLGGLSRQLALNSYLAEKIENHLKLVLKPTMAHLNSDESRQSLANSLAKQALTFDIIIGESEAHLTPLEYRRKIFESLTQEAKNALLDDQNLNLLKATFDAQIDESTIRAVASGYK